MGVAGFSHETVSFWPGVTSLADFERNAKYGTDVLDKARGTNSCIGGFMEVCEAEDIELVPILNASGGATATVADEVYDHYVPRMVEGFKEIKNDLDGILLALHGAMATESRTDPETDAVRDIREAVGYEMPIRVTLDLHGNKDEALIKEATGVFGYHSSPHVDQANTGVRAAKCMIKTLRGEVKPIVALRKPGVVVPSVFSATTVSPAKDLIDRLKEWETKDGVIDVTVLFGFAWSDVHNLGMSLIAVTDGDQALAERIAKDLSDLAWMKRDDLTGREKAALYGVQNGVSEAIRKARDSAKPIVILDHADRSNDTTFMLRELLRQGAQNVAVPLIYDPDAAVKCVDAGKGATVRLDVGASTGWRDGGKLTVEGEVLWSGEAKYTGTGPMSINREVNLGPAGIIQVDGVWLQVVSRQTSLIDDDPMKQFGYNPYGFDIIVSKSKTHFRAVYEELGEEILIIDAPGQCPADLSHFEYKHVPDGVYPVSRKQ
ncbi:MAG: M81 family metallopeptidase [Candidatus Bathyarchaeota archaeon]|nr:M81 family metallopeptidase [Candidatus Bathyarchaeota archaeon]